MTNFVRILEKYCIDNGIEYQYGSRNVTNILDTAQSHTGLVEGLIYFLHDIDTKEANYNSTKTNIKGHTHSGRLMIVVKSNLDQPFFNEKYLPLLSKYTLNIEPLETVLYDFQVSYGCQNLEFQQFRQMPIINQLDTNFDGWLINYKVLIPIEFSL